MLPELLLQSRPLFYRPNFPCTPFWLKSGLKCPANYFRQLSHVIKRSMITRDNVTISFASRERACKETSLRTSRASLSSASLSLSRASLVAPFELTVERSDNILRQMKLSFTFRLHWPSQRSREWQGRTPDLTEYGDCGSKSRPQSLSWSYFSVDPSSSPRSSLQITGWSAS